MPPWSSWASIYGFVHALGAHTAAIRAFYENFNRTLVTAYPVTCDCPSTARLFRPSIHPNVKAFQLPMQLNSRENAGARLSSRKNWGIGSQPLRRGPGNCPQQGFII